MQNVHRVLPYKETSWIVINIVQSKFRHPEKHWNGNVSRKH